MTVFVLTLLADLTTLVVTTVAAVRKPILSYKLIAATAFCASSFALYQVLTGRGSPITLVFTSLLFVMMMWRVASDFRRVPPRKRL